MKKRVTGKYRNSQETDDGKIRKDQTKKRQNKTREKYENRKEATKYRAEKKSYYVIWKCMQLLILVHMHIHEVVLYLGNNHCMQTPLGIVLVYAITMLFGLLHSSVQNLFCCVCFQKIFTSFVCFQKIFTSGEGQTSTLNYYLTPQK